MVVFHYPAAQRLAEVSDRRRLDAWMCENGQLAGISLASDQSLCSVAAAGHADDLGNHPIELQLLRILQGLLESLDMRFFSRERTVCACAAGYTNTRVRATGTKLPRMSQVLGKETCQPSGHADNGLAAGPARF